jgi:hypothetical protein
MKAEIGIAPDGTPHLTLDGLSGTECSLVEFFRDRLGIIIGPDGLYRIRGTTPAPAKVPLLPPNDIGGPSCNHIHWQTGCSPCADWAVANGVEFARHVGAKTETPTP